MGKHNSSPSTQARRSRAKPAKLTDYVLTSQSRNSKGASSSTSDEAKGEVKEGTTKAGNSTQSAHGAELKTPSLMKTGCPVLENNPKAVTVQFVSKGCCNGTISADSAPISSSIEPLVDGGPRIQTESPGQGGVQAPSATCDTVGAEMLGPQEHFPPLGKSFMPRPAHPPARTTYANKLRRNRNIQLVERLVFHPNVEKGKVKISAADLEETTKEWSATLIGACIGGPYSFEAMKIYVSEYWKVSTPQVFLKDNGIFVFRFNNKEDKEWVKCNGPWMLGGTRPLMLKDWSPGMPITWEVFESVPAWVILPDIDPSLISNHMLSLIGSAIGKPICPDYCTFTKGKLSFARLLVEVTVQETQVSEVIVEIDDGRTLKQKVVFEWLPWICSTCLVFGHSDKFCPLRRKPNNTRSIWVPKASTLPIHVVDELVVHPPLLSRPVAAQTLVNCDGKCGDVQTTSVDAQTQVNCDGKGGDAAQRTAVADILDTVMLPALNVVSTPSVDVGLPATVNASTTCFASGSNGLLESNLANWKEVSPTKCCKRVDVTASAESSRRDITLSYENFMGLFSAFGRLPEGVETAEEADLIKAIQKLSRGGSDHSSSPHG